MRINEEGINVLNASLLAAITVGLLHHIVWRLTILLQLGKQMSFVPTLSSVHTDVSFLLY